VRRQGGRGELAAGENKVSKRGRGELAVGESKSRRIGEMCADKEGRESWLREKIKIKE